MENQKQEMSIELPQFTQVNKRQMQNVIALKNTRAENVCYYEAYNAIANDKCCFPNNAIAFNAQAMDSELQNHADFGVDGMISN